MNKQTRNPAQISMTEEGILDSFAGGGGASTGIEIATGRVVTWAINHDPDAILMHKTNHPYTEHYTASVWDVDPVEVCKGRPVGLAWFSPDCKHFSKAKGSPLVDRNIRGLSWVVVKWALYSPPRVILMENVEEIQTWGPLIPSIDPASGRPLKKIKLIKGGKETTQIVPAEIDETVPAAQLALVPDPDRTGETFQGFIDILTTGISPNHPALLECCEFLKISPDSADAKRLIKGLGYNLEFRELVAADYGAPTSRKRFVLIARCDGRPICWPEPTHGKPGSPDVLSGKLKPWRCAAEIIDWTLPMYSIFQSKTEIKAIYGVNAVRPLADNTLRRIIRGVDKFTIKSGKPFILQGKFQNAPQSADNPLTTITAVGAHEAIDPVLAPVIFANTCNSVGNQPDMPIPTIRTGGGGGQVIAAAQLIQYHDEQTESARGSSLEKPIPTIDGSNRHGLISASLCEYYGNGNPLPLDEPTRTVTSHDREALLSCHLDKYYAGGYTGKGNSPEEPMTTITVEPRQSLIAAHIAEFKGADKGQSAETPLRTITASAGEFGLVETKIEQYGPNADLGYWPKVRDLLNKYCGYTLADNEILLLHIGGAWLYIRDITMRMLAPRELYNAMGFPPDYIIDFTDPKTGKEYPKSAKVARCGNAVCPPMAEAVVRANLPEWCGGKIETMDQLRRTVAV